MPPILKISREMVIEAGYKIVDEQGIDCVNCRNIAKELQCSTQPVFSRFPNMEELKAAVFHYACDKLENAILSDANKKPSIDKAVLELVDLAQNHSNIFHLIYLNNDCGKSTFIEDRMTYQSNKIIIKELRDAYQISEEKALDVMERISLFTHGICTVIATSDMAYSAEQVLSMVRRTLEQLVV